MRKEPDIIEFLHGLDFSVVHKITLNPTEIEFELHNHDDYYEIDLLLDGDCEFIVEGNAYKLKPYDIFLSRPFEFHHIACLSDRTYERIIIHIKADYFTKNDCEEFLDIFRNRRLGTGNLISADITGNTIRNCIERLYEYYNDGAYKAADGVVMEFLYLINNMKSKTDNFYTKNERIRDIIVYINRHLTEELSLDRLSEHFFIDKYYLCKSFKKSTGHTVKQYINNKRILLAQELHRGGQTLLQASLNSGFNSYAHFYKTYVKQTGKSPKSM